MGVVYCLCLGVGVGVGVWFVFVVGGEFVGGVVDGVGFVGCG